jgi:hypothetical protein
VSASDDQARQRIAVIKRRITEIDLACSGTLLERTKVCGKPSCRCASDEQARHGPYYEWNRWLQGRLHHRAVARAQARMITRAMNDYQRLLALLEDWEQESARIILGPERLTPRHHRG